MPESPDQTKDEWIRGICHQVCGRASMSGWKLAEEGLPDGIVFTFTRNGFNLAGEPALDRKTALYNACNKLKGSGLI